MEHVREEYDAINRERELNDIIMRDKVTQAKQLQKLVNEVITLKLILKLTEMELLIKSKC